MGEKRLPDPSFFTIEQLAEYWRVPGATVADYLMEQHLRPALRPADPPHVHALDISLTLQTDEDDWTSGHELPIRMHTAISARVSGAPIAPSEWVYFDLTSATAMSRDDSKELYAVLSTRRAVDEEATERLLSAPFMLFDGRPVEVLVEVLLGVADPTPDYLDEIWIDSTATFIIPLEEVRRFETNRGADIFHTIKPETQQAWLVNRLERAGVDPKAVPRQRGGKRGLKAEMKSAALQERPDLFTSDSFDHVWKKLPKIDP
ncbi:hypothetical protein [Parahaliea aestuarii]|uniref:Uncharacterized protein n=1 Tax=Parahaliea aestuarii TaxID=1852021 RepID=A0A5C9A1U7_9GAMM|nr:hypothetical protein [Parahaliea aestuarii]TXS94748.1 hypothetical protein FVW59_02215 [Parahaliea aestuarii]